MKSKKTKLLVVLPAFNEEKVIEGVLKSLKKELKNLKLTSEIVVIDDASVDKTAKKAQKEGVAVLKHVINRGLGGALQTGLEYGRKKKVDVVVTMDSDGQHDSKDIEKIIGPIMKKKADVVIGSRFLEVKNKIPVLRRIILKLSDLVTFLFFGIYPTDSQSGFRAFSRKAINKIKLRTQQMEVSSEFFDQIRKNKLKFCEVPIRVIYTPYSLAKGQSNLNGIKVLVKLVLRLGR
ncbi:glycosyltransferase family 2 protein [Candidatus Beckwithbacteria bacterium CG10_big_fil_rev_8_21_14_0_10_34_10]|uniref:Glycosyltransferase family 2 protein n=1 Tax=Candidatus Beckwithbacteria bacterium CG10_big_fil_rev_8_21_14_0_10_34_10 TaxID=1974495 RepID=A0A2H0W9N8_9BACT|nr:MAG: glycosyltransferase family 2 protein [Candidatus Beckwithbacteria bacterium CG10_big_fil_rev_8_21_14_0_10_34_10]